MRKSWGSVSAVALVALAAALAIGQAPRASNTDDKAIRQAATDYAAAMTKGDLDAVAGFWAADAEYVDDSGTVHRGRDAIIALFKKALADLKGTKFTARVASVRFLNGGTAIQEGEFDMTAANGVTDRNRYTAVWVKDGDKWRIGSARDLPDDTTTIGTAKALKDLEWLVGDWVSENRELPVTLTARWALDKHFLVCEFNAPHKDGTTMTVVQWFGFDPTADRLRTWTFDARGGYSDAQWGREGNEWTAEMTGILSDGRTGSAKVNLKFVDDQSCIWTLRDREVDGQPIADSVTKYVRKTAVAKN